MIKLKNISKTFEKDGGISVHALKDVSLEIGKGELVAIIGPSGSGKSTLMNLLGLLDTPTSGQYELENREVSTLNVDELAEIRNQKIGFVFQAFHLLARTSAAENVELPLIYSDKTNIRKLALDALRSVGLENRESHYPSELSGGQQQRVAIARALVNDPEIILADEPTGNLDSKSGLEILSIFQDLNQEGKTVIIITHDQEIASMCHRIMRIVDGEIVSDEQVAKPLDARLELAGLDK